MSLTSIPKDFGQGGANIGEGRPKLAEILIEHKEAIESGGTDSTARAAAAAAQSTADGAQSSAEGAQSSAEGALATAQDSYFPAFDTRDVPDEDMSSVPAIARMVVRRGPDGTGTLTADRTITLDPTDCVAKQIFYVEMEYAQNGAHANHVVHVVNGGPGAGTLFSFHGTATFSEYAKFIFDGTDFSLVEHSRLTL